MGPASAELHRPVGVWSSEDSFPLHFGACLNKSSPACKTRIKWQLMVCWDDCIPGGRFCFVSSSLCSAPGGTRPLCLTIMDAEDDHRGRVMS